MYTREQIEDTYEHMCKFYDCDFCLVKNKCETELENGRCILDVIQNKVEFDIND